VFASLVNINRDHEVVHERRDQDSLSVLEVHHHVSERMIEFIIVHSSRSRGISSMRSKKIVQL
jgi:hypothetical protein